MTSRRDRAWGTNDIESLFPDESPTTVGVFPRTPELKHRHPYDQDLVSGSLASDERNMQPVDPREVSNLQGGLVRHIVKHYMTSSDVHSDRHNAGNEDPVVYDRGDTKILLGGNHRAAAALLQGRQFDAHVISGGWGGER